MIRYENQKLRKCLNAAPIVAEKQERNNGKLTAKLIYLKSRSGNRKLKRARNYVRNVKYRMTNNQNAMEKINSCLISSTSVKFPPLNEYMLRVYLRPAADAANYIFMKFLSIMYIGI